MNSGAYEDLTSPAIESADAEIRRGFAQKVFGILGAQLAFTLGAIGLFSLNTTAKNFVDIEHGGHQWPFVLALVTSFVCIISLTCCANQARTYPNNYVFLGLFTLAESVLLGTVCVAYELDSLALAVGVTASLAAGLVTYAQTTSSDFTGAGPYLFMALWVMIAFGFMVSFFPALAQGVDTAYSFAGVVLFSFYIIYDVQLVLGGKHARFRYGVDDYVFAALNLYLDVLNLFIHLLELLGRRRDN